MWKYIIKNAILSLIVLFIMAFVVYVVYVTINGNPLSTRRDNFFKDEVSYEQLLHYYQIDLPPVERAGIWFKNIFTGDFGFIYQPEVSQASDVPTAFFEPLLTSMQVQIPAYFISMIVGLVLGIWAGYSFASKKPTQKVIDASLTGFVSIFRSVPILVLAIFALLLAPVVGVPSIYEEGAGLEFRIQTLIFPIILTTLVSLAYWTLRMRIEVASILTSDYILAARTKGFSEGYIFRRYVWRNALYPYIGELATMFAIVFASSFTMEVYFGVIGTQQMLLRAATNGEVNILMFQLVFIGLIFLGIRVISEAAQFSIDPRVRASLGRDWQLTRIVRAQMSRRAKANETKAEEVTSD